MVNDVPEYNDFDCLSKCLAGAVDCGVYIVLRMIESL